MNTITKKNNAWLHPDEIFEVAKSAIREALKNHVMPPDDQLENLTWGFFVGNKHDEQRIFELYIAADKPENAQVLAEARVSRRTGEADVKVLLPRKTED